MTMKLHTLKKRQLKNSAIDIGAKPKRPLSAYNIFYRLSRKLLRSSNSSGEDASTFVASIFHTISSMDRSALFDMSLRITKEYRNEIAGKERTVNNLKPLGILGFKDLTRVIAAQWINLTKSVKSIFESCSLEDKKIYTNLRNIWNSEKDAKIRKKLDEQSLREDSAAPSSQGVGRTQINSQSSFTCPSSCATGLVPLISHEQTISCDKSLQTRCLEQKVHPSSSDVSFETDQREASRKKISSNPSCFPVRADQLNFSQVHPALVQSIGIGDSKVSQHNFFNDPYSSFSSPETHEPEFLYLREKLLRDEVEGENLHDLFISMLK